MQRAIIYCVLAVLAILANLLVQELTLRFFSAVLGSAALFGAMLAGTVAGLVSKYGLDKRYIFGFQAASALENGQTFLLYSLMGGITTCLFWVVELGFHYVFGTPVMRYVGAVLGLSAGYLLKYQLDKHFVFKSVALT